MWEYVEHGQFTTWPNSTLSAILLDLQGFSVHDPRDHVYGVLGLYRSHKLQPQPVLVPHYAKSLAEVLQDATRWTFEGNLARGFAPNYHEITHRPGDLRSGEFPSWVMRWDRAWEVGKDALPISASSFAGGPGPLNRLPTLGPQDRFGVVGRIFDRIKTAGPVWQWATFRSARALLIRLEKPRLLCEAQGKTDDSALAMTLVAGFDLQPPSPPRRAKRALECFLGFVREGKLSPDGFDRQQSNQSMRPGSSDVELASDYLEAMTDACAYRRCFITNSGYFGIGPQVWEPGDIIVVFRGYHLPVMLRPLQTKDPYQFCGVTYVYGIMDGKWMETEIARRARNDVFWLV